MAARGADEKLHVIKEIQKVFPNMFEDDKVWRIPVGDVEIKISLTCAKDVIGGGSGAVITKAPKKEDEMINFDSIATSFSTPTDKSLKGPTQEEKENIANLIVKFDL